MKQKNIVLIVADDMGYGDLGMFNPSVRTPNLDQLANQGVCLRQHYTASPICSPARAALLTGRYPHRTGAITQHEIHGLDRIGLHETTIADIFKRAGYKTGLIGKWHNGTFDSRFEPNARGFEEFVGFCGGWSDYYKYKLKINQKYQASNGEYLTDLLTSESINFIKRHKSQPFFLQIAYSAPHSPFQAPAENVNYYLNKGFNRVVATTYAMIEIMDHGIGNVMHALNDFKIEDNTIVLFTSDNGPAFFNPPYMLEPEDNTLNERFNCGYKGAKGYVEEGGIRVPMIIRYPEHKFLNNFSDGLFHFTDWLPTLTRMVGIEYQSELKLDGYDVFDLLFSNARQEEPRQFWQWNFYYPYIGTNAAMREGKWKLLRPTISGTRFFNKELYASDEDVNILKDFLTEEIKHKEDPEKVKNILPVPKLLLLPPEPPQLYNLEIDPHESNDLSAQYPDRVANMLSQLENWFENVEAERLQSVEKY